MIHLYCGEGKGKTTAAMGLALRMAGRGRRVVIAQFLKGADSGERLALAQLPHIILLEVPEQIKFTFAMDETERRQAAADCQALLDRAAALAAEPDCAMVVLDEVCAALATGLLPLSPLLELLDRPGPEFVLTGRDPHPELEARAHYITCCQKVRHPYEGGTPARSGVEF